MEDHRFYKHKHVLTSFEKNIFLRFVIIFFLFSLSFASPDVSSSKPMRLDSLIWTMFFFFFASSQNHMIWNRIIEKNRLWDSVLIRIYLETCKDIFAINMHFSFSFRLFMFSVHCNKSPNYKTSAIKECNSIYKIQWLPLTCASHHLKSP